MPKAFPKEFREDVIRVYKDSDASMAQVAKDFGISPSCLKRWLAIDERNSSRSSGSPQSGSESDALREANKADQAARAGERGASPGGCVSVAGASAGKMMYPLVRELAVDGIPVAVTRRVLNLARQPYYRWLKCPITDAELTPAYRANPLLDAHRDDPELGYRFLLDEARQAGQPMAEPNGPRGGSAPNSAGGRCSGRSAAATARSRVRRSTTTRRAELHRGRFEPAVALRHHRAQDPRRQAVSLRDQGRPLQPGSSATPSTHGCSPGSPSPRSTTPSPAAAPRVQRWPAACCTPTAGRSSGPGSWSTSSTATTWSARWAASARPATTQDMESFFSLLQKNVLDRRVRKTREELRSAIVTWIERTYNRRRRQAALGRLTPVEYELIMTPTATQAA
jgi:putative transposase